MNHIIAFELTISEPGIPYALPRVAIVLDSRVSGNAVVGPSHEGPALSKLDNSIGMLMHGKTVLIDCSSRGTGGDCTRFIDF